MRFLPIVFLLLFAGVVFAQDANTVTQTPEEKIQAFSVSADGCDWYITEEAAEQLCGRPYHAFCASDYLLEAECSYDEYIKTCEPERCLFDQLHARDDKIVELNQTIADLNEMTLPELARTVGEFKGQLTKNNEVAEQPFKLLSMIFWLVLIGGIIIFKLLPWWAESQAKRRAGIELTTCKGLEVERDDGTKKTAR